MNRLEASFAERRAAGKKTLVAYLCMGDPDLAESVELAVAAAEAGADVLELGVPFSDPTADGPVIAKAALRAIKNGATIARVIEAAGQIRARTSVPLVLFTYYNPVLITGEARVVELAAAAGLDAILCVDLPPEEAAPLREAATAKGIALVPLVTPTSHPARVDAILAAATSGAPAPKGFLYYVSMTGVTGAGSADFAAARAHASALRERSGWPVVVGFGIDGPAAAQAAAGSANEPGPDGIVVGTALVKRIQSGTDPAARKLAVTDFVGSLRAALDVSR